MRTGRSYVATAVALGIITLSGCAAESGDQGSAGAKASGPNADDWGDENKYPELGGKFAGLTAFNGTCTFVSGTMTVTAAAGVDQALVIGKRAVDSALVVNGALLTGCTTATSSTVKALKVVGTTGNQTVIVDFLGGVFAPGIATARGIVIDLGADTSGDEVRFRGTSVVDAWVYGSDGLAVNADAFRDVDFLGVERLNFSLAGGNDTLTGTIVAAGLGSGKGVTATATTAFTAFGGDGNDTITGGGGNDVIYGGLGNDTLSGGAVGASGKNWLSGQQGADIIAQGTTAAKDIISCGIEDVIDADHPDLSDTVTYALRGTLAVRDSTSALTVAATDGQRTVVTLGTCTDTVVGTCDVDAQGFDVYSSPNGLVTENFATGVLTAAESDEINADCEIVVGGMDNDRLTGSDPDATITSGVVDGNNNLQGGPGDDVLVGGLGDDVLSGDENADTLDESGAVNTTGNDVLNGGSGTDLVTYASRSLAVTVTMDGTTADDGCTGETDNVKGDVENLIGTAQGDTITGNALDNVITGGLGADTIDGAGANDTFDEGSVTSGADLLHGGAGLDTVDYSARTVAGVWVTLKGELADDGEGTLPTHAVSTQAQIVGLDAVVATGTSAEGDTIFEDVENVNGSLLADDLSGNDSANNIDGGPGADYIFGGAGDDILFGGNAVTVGGTPYSDGNDYIYGGAGNDTLDGAGATANKLVCGAGEDIGYNQGTASFTPSTGVGAYRDSSCES